MAMLFPILRHKITKQKFPIHNDVRKTCPDETCKREHELLDETGSHK